MLWGFSRNNFFLSNHKCCVVGLHTRISSNWELFVVLLWREESGERKWNTRNCLTKVDQSHTRESGIWVIFCCVVICYSTHFACVAFVSVGLWVVRSCESPDMWVRKMEFPGRTQRSNSYILKSLNETKHVSNKSTNKAQITSESSQHHTKERWNNFSIFSYQTFEEILV